MPKAAGVIVCRLKSFQPKEKIYIFMLRQEKSVPQAECCALHGSFHKHELRERAKLPCMSRMLRFTWKFSRARAVRKSKTSMYVQKVALYMEVFTSKSCEKEQNFHVSLESCALHGSFHEHELQETAKPSRGLIFSLISCAALHP